MIKRPVSAQGNRSIATALAPLLTVEEAASILHLSVRQVRRMIAHEALPVIRLGRVVRISTAALEELVKI